VTTTETESDLLLKQKTLIVPDVHQQTIKLNSLRDLFDEAERVVFLGDFFDSYVPGGLMNTIEWLNANFANEKFEFLFGNHDCHYAFSNRNFRCSGYTDDSAALISQHLNPAVWERFKVFTRVGCFLLSHAGVRPETLRYSEPDVEQEALMLARSGSFHPLWNAGWARGGRAQFGGPTWLDWRHEFIGVPAQPQIVGHTNGKDVRVKGPNYCLDTNLTHVAWVTGYAVKVVRIDRTGESRSCGECGGRLQAETA
jgi:hypothetical protein